MVKTNPWVPLCSGVPEYSVFLLWLFLRHRLISASFNGALTCFDPYHLTNIKLENNTNLNSNFYLIKSSTIIFVEFIYDFFDKLFDKFFWQNFWRILLLIEKLLYKWVEPPWAEPFWKRKQLLTPQLSTLLNREQLALALLQIRRKLEKHPLIICDPCHNGAIFSIEACLI